LKNIIVTSDGSHTIYVPELNEHYHSVHGAVQESEFIFIKTGFESCNSNPVNIFEAGFGTGLNALLTALKSLGDGREVHYTTIERYPLPPDITDALNYDHFTNEEGGRIFRRIHLAPWNTPVRLLSTFTLTKIEGDLTTHVYPGMYDLIYFDAFGPDKQPEMWSAGIFEALSAATVKGGILVTYSAKGEVKRNLRAAGFNVKLLPGPPGKRQIIRAVKI